LIYRRDGLIPKLKPALKVNGIYLAVDCRRVRLSAAISPG
jgi:hypothetical protein